MYKLVEDTREMFDGLVTRKPGGWDEVNFVTADRLSREHVEKLLSKHVVQVSSDVHPLHDFLPSSPADDEEIEFVVVRKNEHDELETYYVNTEGYSYARYTFRFSPFGKFLDF